MSGQASELFTCPSCRERAPRNNYCVRCGTDLARAGRRRRFAAAPNELRGLPSVVSTLFPQLPRSSMIGFRIALIAGVVIVVMLEIADLFPLAVTAAAVLVPLLTILYLYDVDEYEDQPLRVVAVTVVWGAAVGVGVGLLGRYVSPSGVVTLAESTQRRVLVLGLGIPLLGTMLMICGPLTLLPYRKFNDTLDGATFGAACAVTFVGAQVLTQSTELFSAGLRSPGLVYPRVVYLIEFAFAMPIVAAGAVGAASGSLWLRYRAPARDRHALGEFGKPFVAIPLAAAFMIAAAFDLLYVPRRTPALIVLLALAALALLWLRQVIHVGLIQEAAEIEVGPDLTCANCGHRTARHTFCGNCGIALKALPKTSPRRPPGGATSEERRWL